MCNKIYTVTVASKMNKSVLGWPDFGDARTVGYYMNKEDAISSVKENNCDIWECCYTYAFVEEVCEGLYQPVTKCHRWLFKYNVESEEYEEIEEPEWLENFCGLSIG